MNTLIKFIGFALVLWLLWQWVNEKRQGDFKYNLPEQKSEAKENAFKSDTVPLRITRMSPENIPLIEPGNFELNPLYKSQLADTYSLLFDSLKILQLSFSQVARTSLVELDAATVIQLLAYHETLPDRSEKNAAAIAFIGLILSDKQEVDYFVKDYLMAQDLWIKYMRNLHFLLMEQPKHDVLNAAYLALLMPADTDQTLDYLKVVQFIERDYHDDYYSANLKVLDRFDEKVLLALLDKVDDYSWYAAYPERDAEQGILKILEGR